ncbi:TetR family transcriptional regulator C-terminal domain-containing protein [Streptomyces sp. NPDC001508]|uniref:TetR family transcriptional regulator C-terminal domain-containing protein n=1 Tax=Streptomyces sp. NPDC001508 TaxID=3154656 RepID=UPI00331AFA30
MGHREQLMIGAKKCLQELGYARTTSRDLAAAAGAPLGSINYHYHSKDELLNAALLELLREWGDRTVARAAAEADAGAGVGQRLLALWAGVVEAQESDRPMLVASVEAYAQAERSAEVRDQIGKAYERSRPELAAALHGLGAEGEPEVVRAVGSVHMALIAGLSLQWLVDPERAPSAHEVAVGLRAIADSLDNDAVDVGRVDSGDGDAPDA